MADPHAAAEDQQTLLSAAWSANELADGDQNNRHRVKNPFNKLLYHFLKWVQSKCSSRCVRDSTGAQLIHSRQTAILMPRAHVYAGRHLGFLRGPHNLVAQLPRRQRTPSGSMKAPSLRRQRSGAYQAWGQSSPRCLVVVAMRERGRYHLL